MKLLFPYIAIAVVSFILNFLWEYFHIPLYRDYEQLGSGITLTVWATAGDVMYTLLVVLFVALCKWDARWFKKAQPSDYALLGLLGFATAMCIEYKAQVLHRWAYSADMPLFFGIGLSPLLQLTILIPLSVLIVVTIQYRRSN